MSYYCFSFKKIISLRLDNFHIITPKCVLVSWTSSSVNCLFICFAQLSAELALGFLSTLVTYVIYE